MMSSRSPHARRLSRRSANRKAAVTVELALVLPLLVVLVLALIDVSQFIVAEEVINRASLAGAKHAADATTVDASEVTQVIHARVREAYPNLRTSQIEESLDIVVADSMDQPLTGNSLANLSSGASLSVDVNFNFDTVRWIRGFPGLDGRSVGTKTVVRRE